MFIRNAGFLLSLTFYFLVINNRSWAEIPVSNLTELSDSHNKSVVIHNSVKFEIQGIYLEAWDMKNHHRIWRVTIPAETIIPFIKFYPPAEKSINLQVMQLNAEIVKDWSLPGLIQTQGKILGHLTLQSGFQTILSHL